MKTVFCINFIMRVYQYRTRKKKKINIRFLLVVIVLLTMTLFFIEEGERISKIRTEIEKICYEKAVTFSVPGVVYHAKGEEPLDIMAELVTHFFPIGDYASETEDYQTQIESELSYEMILAKEAADENYVDEDTGKLVDTGNTFLDENRIAKEEAQADSGTGPVGEEIPEENAAVSETPAADTAAAGTLAQPVVSYSREKLNDFDYLIQNFYQVDSTTTINGSQLNADTLLGKDMRLSHDNSTPQVLIYHTHSQEGYADSVPGDASTTVVGVGDYLARILSEQYGINVIHHKGEYDVGDRDHAYTNAAPALEQILEENPEIEVVIDLHRDGVSEETHLVTTQNGVNMAQIMFFNGLSRTTSTGDIAYLYNPYIADNLALSFQVQLKAAEYYPGFTRRIYLKGYRYNMHYRPKSLLIEVGAQTNTVEEAMNAMVPLADVLYKVLTGPIT